MTSVTSRAAAVVVSAALMCSLAGCGAGVNEELDRALRDTRAAVRSAALAVELMQDERSTRAAAEVTASDMADQIGTVQKQLLTIPGKTIEDRQLRARCQAVVTDALVAVQETEDLLAADDDGTSSLADLSRADADIAAALEDVGQR